ncbi:MAG TPA: DUF2892 domain-containing protein [Cerasibacillus sp.]|uniref:YgaP family membrane protein n=1 Tax=Cerasibacillus sp. TaxID=2498711 RepID=UPI002F42D403
MEKNVGNVDRVIRFIVGIVLLSLLFMLEGGIKWVGLLGIVMIFTALVGYCPLYKPLGINTNKGK